MRKVNRAGLNLIKEFEGCELKAYQDSVGVWTIGYGHIEGVKRGDVITKAEADRIFEEDINIFAKGVENLITADVTDNQFAAMVSLAFNVGLANFKKSTLLRLVNREEFRHAADQFLVWNRAGGQVLNGLTRRRKAERVLFLTASDGILRAAATNGEESAVAPSPSSPALPSELAEANQSPSETKVEVVGGDVKVSTTEGAKPEEKIAVEKPPAKNFAKEVRTDITAVTGGEVGIQAVREAAESVNFLGLSPRFWVWISIFAVVAGAVYLVMKYLKFRSEVQRDLELTKTLVNSNSTDANKIVFASKEELEDFKARGYKIVYR